MKRTNGFLLVEAHGAFDAVCQAYSCLIDVGDFAIERISPALVQYWDRGRYNFGRLEFMGEWRVPCRVRTDDAGTIPDDVRRFLENVGSFLDLRVYPEQCATDDSGECHGDRGGEQPQHWEVIYAGSADGQQSSEHDSALLAGTR
jgi:hypothetical protein